MKDRLAIVTGAGSGMAAIGLAEQRLDSAACGHKESLRALLLKVPQSFDIPRLGAPHMSLLSRGDVIE